MKDQQFVELSLDRGVKDYPDKLAHKTFENSSGFYYSFCGGAQSGLIYLGSSLSSEVNLEVTSTGSGPGIQEQTSIYMKEKDGALSDEDLLYLEWVENQTGFSKDELLLELDHLRDSNI